MRRSEEACQSEHARLFADGDWTPEDVLISEQIPPVHPAARDALIDCYCPVKLKDGAKSQNSNNDCLVRLYLGKRRDHTTRLKPRDLFGLRNFPLCLDQMQVLGLDTTRYAVAMAEALAIMHWETKIDAADVELVLGGAPCLTYKPPPNPDQVLALQEHFPITPVASDSGYKAAYIWLLDFNQCQPMTMDETGIGQAVKRFFDNDPCYPRPPAHPNCSDMGLWEDFKSRYLVVSQRFVNEEERELPGKFIERVRTAAHERRKMKDEAAQLSDSYSVFEAAASRNC